MKINLRKAHAIQSRINEELKRLDMSTTEVLLNEYEDVEEQVNSAYEDFVERLETYDKLSGVLLCIRKSVDQANAANQISDLLADAAAIDKRIRVYSELANAQPKESEKMLEGRLSKVRNSDNDSGYGFVRSGISTGFFDTNTISDFRDELANLKRVKQDVQDMILKKNVETEITLDEMSVKILSDFGIM